MSENISNTVTTPKPDGLFPEQNAGSTYRAALWTMAMLILSVGFYFAIFLHVGKPFSIGIYVPMIDAKIKKLSESEAPRILIIAGSNARISHQAEILEEETGIPSTNGGLTADLSLDFLIATYEPHLKSGDVVYLPLEYDPLCLRTSRTKSERVYLAAYGQTMLATFPLRDQLESRFCFELGDLFSEVIERQAVRSSGVANRRAKLNRWGDQVGYNLESAKRYRDRILNGIPGPLPRANDFRNGSHTKRVLLAFMERCASRGITVIGGLPTIYADREIDPQLIQEIRAFYVKNGHHFLLLPNQSQYPRELFYDSPYHLIDTAAESHTRLLAPQISKIIEDPHR